MTKRGSIVYYLSAWVFGCFFTSVVVGFFGSDHPIHFTPLPSSDPVRDFLGVFLIFFVTGGASALAFGFLLRWTMLRLKWTRAAQWIAAGAVLSFFLVYLLARTGHLLSRSGWMDAPWFIAATSVLFGGPSGAFQEGPALILPAGALTAYVLFLVNRAFDPRQSPAV